MKLGLQLGYWGAQPPENHGELVAEAEAAGFDAVFTAEAWGSDAYTPLSWWGSSTQRVRLGTSVVQLSARTPTACAMAAEVCDGWLPIFYTPRMADTYNEWLDEGFARPGARRSREDFEICATANIVITDDRAAAFAAMKPYIALYMGGMGAEDTNFHADVYRRMGYSEVVDEVTKLFRSNQKDKAAEIIPDEVIDDAAIVGDVDYVRKQIKAWEAAGVTMMVISGRSAEQVRELATLV